ncbi:MAG: Coq4 family protein [Cyanobacteriota bacterium]|nr:Coq4 family protein [Cyanobacteriota bacterium]
MSFSFKKVFQAIQASKNTEYLGDIAILKSEEFGVKIKPDFQEKMQPVVGYHPKIDLNKLSQLPSYTLGYQYAEHMKRNYLQPFEISPEVSKIAENNVFSLRYAITHDLFHILLGFDTSYAGEIGVLAFAVEQDYSSSLEHSLRVARLLYPILAPQQISQIFNNLRRGRELGKQAKFLLNYRFEDNWEKSLEEVKIECGLA